MAHQADFDLIAVFEEVNRRHFDGFLDAPTIRWNSRLRSSAGRFIPGSRKFWRERPAVIEIASYLVGEARAAALIADTMAHEMIHFWLWIRRKPYGHTAEFLVKMRAMGVSRYNPVPCLRPFRYIYLCSACQKEFPTKRALGVLACAKCCKAYSSGRFDRRFELRLLRKLSREEGLLLISQRVSCGTAASSGL